jgi:hypothetical protein
VERREDLTRLAAQSSSLTKTGNYSTRRSASKALTGVAAHAMR